MQPRKIKRIRNIGRRIHCGHRIRPPRLPCQHGPERPILTIITATRRQLGQHGHLKRTEVDPLATRRLIPTSTLALVLRGTAYTGDDPIILSRNNLSIAAMRPPIGSHDRAIQRQPPTILSCSLSPKIPQSRTHREPQPSPVPGMKTVGATPLPVR